MAGGGGEFHHLKWQLFPIPTLCPCSLPSKEPVGCGTLQRAWNTGPVTTDPAGKRQVCKLNLPNLPSSAGRDASPAPQGQVSLSAQQRSGLQGTVQKAALPKKNPAPAKKLQDVMGGSEEEAGAGSQAPFPLSLESRWSKLRALCLSQPPLPG